jgi:hypothetical protein
MMKRMIVGVSSLAAVLVLVASACSPAAWDTEVPGSADPASSPKAPGCDPKAPKKLEPMDPSGLEKCCAKGATGAAHCMPLDKTPASYQKSMEPCGGSAGGACIPDALIKSGGARPKDCETSRGKGVCLSVCVPSVAAKKELLERGDCGGDEMCVPCISPLDNKPTGACDIGSGKSDDDECKGGTDGGAAPTPPAGGGSALECPFKGPPVDFTKFPACAPGARCVPAAAVPEKQRGMLKSCESAGLCVPEPMIATRGNYTAPTCNSVAGAEGRCLSTAIPLVADQASFLPQDSCAAAERCVPCTNPLTGEATPACTIGCDSGPKKPPTVAASCCGGLAKCLPSSAIPPSQRDSMNSDGCASAELCVPKDIGNKKPQTCSASFFTGGGKGVCLSKCLEFGFFGNILIDQEDCTSADHVCVPCVRNGTPTNAPGCS